MLTYELNKRQGLPLYEALYRCIREDILNGTLQPGQKLPSKRALAAHLEVSKITVEGAYDQLLAEGYLTSREKVGYFVAQVESHPVQPIPQPVSSAPTNVPIDAAIDLTSNAPVRFPFSVWSSLQRQVIRDVGEGLLSPLPNLGLWQLRQAIADHLLQFRGMQVQPEHILIGAGTDFLYNLLIQLLGRDILYACEEPGYGKIRQIYAAGGVRCISAPMDREGVIPSQLADARVLHISPSHHFPTGIITPISRRQELLGWAGTDKWIIEDDYDSEFRFNAHPVPAMRSLDRQGRVIYMNTFSKTLAPSIRISYMILPPALMERFQQTLGFYSCTVPSFEQHTLARFLSEGFFEKHLNRMRKFYRTRRDRVLNAIASSPPANKLTILEENAGLHFLIRVDTLMTDRQLTDYCRSCGLKIHTLSHYYHEDSTDTRLLVVNYSGLTDEELTRLEEILRNL